MEYLNAFNDGLIKVLPLSSQGTETFLYMMLGMAIGFAVGILPGLGGATTLALMLPFIYNMDPITAFAFLLGSNAVTATTGDITSVLSAYPAKGSPPRPLSTVIQWQSRVKPDERSAPRS